MKCRCADRGCPVHPGARECFREGGPVLFRVDMQDETGTLFCIPCSSDAMKSGLFSPDGPGEDWGAGDQEALSLWMTYRNDVGTNDDPMAGVFGD